MDKICYICHKDGTFKCPTCLVFYCSLNCCKKHREVKCDVVKFTSEEDEEEQVVKKRKTSNLYAPEDKLKIRKNSEQNSSLLGSNHSRNLPVTIDEADNVEELLEKTNEEPIFEGIPSTCLNVGEFKKEVDEGQINDATIKN